MTNPSFESSYKRESPRNIEWKNDVYVLSEALKYPDGYNYEARLPDIIGYVPLEEQEQFSTFTPHHIDNPSNFVCLHMDDEEIAYLATSLPKTVHTLVHDTHKITEGKAILSELELRRQFVRRGHDPHFYGLHLDVGVTTDQPDMAKLPIYLISDMEPTLFYTGPAMLYMPDKRSVRLNTASLNPDQNLTQAPPFAIMRLSYATIHTAPIFTTDATRTFMRAFATLDPDAS